MRALSLLSIVAILYLIDSRNDCFDFSTTSSNVLPENFEGICLSRKISLPFRSISNEKFIYTPIDSRSSFGSI